MRDKSINYYRVEQAIRYMEANFKSHPDLDQIARKINLSPFHFQRMFLDWVGITPKKFLQFLTVSYLKKCIYNSSSVIEAADMAGLSSQSRVYDLFVKIEGVSPRQYKSAGLGVRIFYGYHNTPFGICFIAVTERGVCELIFIDHDINREEFARFETKWHLAERIHKPEYTQNFIQRIFKSTPHHGNLQMLVQAADFQIKVWEALVKIPFGQINLYGYSTAQSDIPYGAQVMPSADFDALSYLIPCQRIITKSEAVGAYHAGKVRKKLMIEWDTTNGKLSAWC